MKLGVLRGSIQEQLEFYHIQCLQDFIAEARWESSATGKNVIPTRVILQQQQPLQTIPQLLVLLQHRFVDNLPFPSFVHKDKRNKYYYPEFSKLFPGFLWELPVVVCHR